jgi:hypothetical protein
MQPERINPTCEIEYGGFWTDCGLPCGKHSVTQCADCGLCYLRGMPDGVLRRFLLYFLLRLPRDELVLTEATPN